MQTFLWLTALPAHAFEVINPINEETFAGVIWDLAKIVVEIAVPLAAIFLIYAGILFVSAQGREEQLKRAKSVFWYTIVATAIIVGAYAIASAIVDFFPPSAAG